MPSEAGEKTGEIINEAKKRNFEEKREGAQLCQMLVRYEIRTEKGTVSF